MIGSNIVLLDHCIVSLCKGQGLRRIILLHFGLATFRFSSGKDRKPIMFMMSGFSGVSMIPKTIFVYVCWHQDTSKNSRKCWILFEIELCSYSTNVGDPEQQNENKMGFDKSWRSVLKFPRNLEYRMNIWQKTWNRFFEHLASGWFASSAWVVCIFRLGGLHLLVGVLCIFR